MPETEGPGATEADRALADELVDAMSSVRRAVRRQAGQVEEVARLDATLSSNWSGWCAASRGSRWPRRRPNWASPPIRSAPSSASWSRQGCRCVQSDPGDHRVARLSLAPRVAEGMGVWLERRSSAVAEALAGLPPADRQALAEALGPLSRLAWSLGSKCLM